MTEIIYKRGHIMQYTSIKMQYEELLKIAKNIYEVGLYSKNLSDLTDFLDRNGEIE